MDMSDEHQFEVYRAQREMQSKYVHFLLAAAGAGIGLAVNQTRDAAMGWVHLPLAFAVVLWGLSFFYGCRHLQNLNAVFEGNTRVLRLEATAPSPATKSDLMSQLQRSVRHAGRCARLQFRCLVAGAVVYVVWHAWGMYLRRIAG
jgi:hypothetical protein